MSYGNNLAEDQASCSERWTTIPSDVSPPDGRYSPHLSPFVLKAVLS
jgi:hypothetical protein